MSSFKSQEANLTPYNNTSRRLKEQYVISPGLRSSYALVGYYFPKRLNKTLEINVSSLWMLFSINTIKERTCINLNLIKNFPTFYIFFTSSSLSYCEGTFQQSNYIPESFLLSTIVTHFLNYGQSRKLKF